MTLELTEMFTGGPISSGATCTGDDFTITDFAAVTNTADPMVTITINFTGPTMSSV